MTHARARELVDIIDSVGIILRASFRKILHGNNVMIKITQNATDKRDK